MVRLRSSMNNKGFSLLEVIIAVGILSAGIVVVLQAFSFSIHITGLSCDIIDAVCLAEDKLQELEFKVERQKITDLFKEGTEKNKFTWNWVIEPYPDSNLLNKLNLNIAWHRLKREEGINVNTYLLNQAQ